MKKLLLISTLIFSALGGFSQLATQANQATQIGQATTLQNTVTLVKESTDSINQNLRVVQARQNTQTNTLTLIKRETDTINQNLRVVQAKQVIETNTLTTIKKGVDTTNQNLRGISAIETLVKKGVDTTNQGLRQVNKRLVYIDSIGQFKSVVVACVSTNTSDAYTTGKTITGTITPNCFSVAIGTGNYEIVSIQMYPSVSNPSVVMNIAVFTVSLTSGGADNTTFSTTTAFNAGYAGGYSFINTTPFAGSQLYESSKVATSGGLTPNGSSLYISPGTSGNVYFVLYAGGAFTPTNRATYNVKFNLKRIN